MDGSRGLAGVLGWALFAFVSAAPALKPPDGEDRGDDAPPNAPAQRSTRPDVIYVTVGALLAGVLQSAGWRIAGVERELLGRFIALAAGLAVIGASTEIALQRHAPRATPSDTRRLRRAMAALVALAILALAGLLNLALD
jgi:hypothetical protein